MAMRSPACAGAALDPPLWKIHITACRCAALPVQLFAWGRGIVEEMCYEIRRAEACVRTVCPSRTSERGGEGDCVKEGGGEEGERERERALGLRLRHRRRC
jgi:hypothetical protein